MRSTAVITVERLNAGLPVGAAHARLTALGGYTGNLMQGVTHT